MAKDKTYRFVGKGEGVPGLPHEVTESRAKALGVLDVLKEAVKNGNYKAVSGVPVSSVKKKDDQEEGE